MLNILNPSIKSMGDLFEEMVDNRIHEYKIDPLVLSCARHRCNLSTSLELAEMCVTGDDHDTAAEIRKYYSQKLCLVSLKNGELSEFRKSLAEYLTQESKTTLMEKQKGIVYRLPEFYDYDIRIESLISEYSTRRFTDNELQGNYSSTRNFNVIPLLKLRRNTRRGNLLHYWAKDSTNMLYRFVVEADNQLLWAWEEIWKSNSLTIHGNLWPNKLHGRNEESFDYYKVNNWKLVNGFIIDEGNNEG